MNIGTLPGEYKNMAHTLFRSVLLFSLATALGCGSDRPVDEITDVQISGIRIKVIPYTERGTLWGENTKYILCELPGLSNCYSTSAYKAKLVDEIDQALKK